MHKKRVNVWVSEGKGTERRHQTQNVPLAQFGHRPTMAKLSCYTNNTNFK